MVSLLFRVEIDVLLGTRYATHSMGPGCRTQDKPTALEIFFPVEKEMNWLFLLEKKNITITTIWSTTSFIPAPFFRVFVCAHVWNVFQQITMVPQPSDCCNGGVKMGLPNLKSRLPRQSSITQIIIDLLLHTNWWQTNMCSALTVYLLNIIPCLHDEMCVVMTR